MSEQKISIQNLMEKYNGTDCHFFLWGFSKNSKIAHAYEGLLDHAVYYVDNDPRKWGSFINGHKIVSPEAVNKTPDPVILINEDYRQELIPQLEKMGIVDYYLPDGELHCLYPMDELTVERRELQNYFTEYPQRTSGRILIKAFDGLGDTVLKLGFLLKLRERQDIDSYWFVTAKKSVFDFYYRLFKNVIYIERGRYLTDSAYRMDILRRINSLYFKYSICFCVTPSVHKSYDLFNSFNTNIPLNHALYEYLYENDSYLPYKKGLEKLACSAFNFKTASLEGKGILKNFFSKEDCPAIHGKYIVLGMSGDSWGTCYPVIKTVAIVRRLLKEGCSVLLLGYGREADRYNEELLEIINSPCGQLMNFSSRLSTGAAISLLENAALFIGVDSGLAHCAYELDIPSVILMAQVKLNRECYRHVDDNIIYLSERTKCSGCNICRYAQKQERVECISEVPAEAILSKALDMLLQY